VFVLVQADSLIHWLAVPHKVCAEHHALEDGAAEGHAPAGVQSLPGRLALNEAASSAHEHVHCVCLPVARKSFVLPAPASVFLEPPTGDEPQPPIRVVVPALSGERYRLAPSHSPPSLLRSV
jgi:hypothetical protein